MNLTPLVRRLSILTKDIEVVRFQPNWAQMELLNAINEQMTRYNRARIIVLKARQIGISTAIAACGFSLSFMYERYRSLILAHEMKASENLLGMMSLYWDTYPFRDLYTTRYLSRNHISWRETGSAVQVATAANARVGRSATIHFLHASEVGFWDKPGQTMLSLRQTIPNSDGSCICLESTANGQGNYFHKTWNAAVDGDIEYQPLFFPWWRHPEYLASAIGIPYHALGRLDSDERALQAMGVSDDRLAWRRWAVKNLADNDLSKFKQEYPATPDEAFIATGTNIFPREHLDACYKPMPGIQGRLMRDGNAVKFHHNPTGPLRVFRKPASDAEWGRYYIGADPALAGATTSRQRRPIGAQGDYAVLQVINRRTLEQVAIYRSRVDPGTLAEEAAKLGVYYNGAGIGPEREGPGGVVIGKLLGMEYPHVFRHAKIDKTPGKVVADTYGWSTTTQTKDTAIGLLLKVIVDHDLTIHDRDTYQELRDYVTLEGGQYGPASEDGHDDTVMGMAIAIVCHHLEGPLPAYGTVGVLEKPQIDPAWEQWEEEVG